MFNTTTQENKSFMKPIENKKKENANRKITNSKKRRHRMDARHIFCAIVTLVSSSHEDTKNHTSILARCGFWFVASVKMRGAYIRIITHNQKEHGSANPTAQHRYGESE